MSIQTANGMGIARERDVRSEHAVYTGFQYSWTRQLERPPGSRLSQSKGDRCLCTRPSVRSRRQEPLSKAVRLPSPRAGRSIYGAEPEPSGVAGASAGLKKTMKDAEHRWEEQSSRSQAVESHPISEEVLGRPGRGREGASCQGSRPGAG